MRTAEERLKFAIEFSQMEFEYLRQGDLMNLREDLLMFLYPEGQMAQLAKHSKYPIMDTLSWAFNEEDRKPRDFSFVPLLDKPWPQEYSTDEIRALQTKCLSVIESAVYQGHSIRVATRCELNIRLEFVIRPGTDDPSPFVGGSTEDVFMYRLYELLTRESRKRIVSCPSCRKIFYKVRKQKYCSRRCGIRQYMQDYRQTEKGQAAIARANATQYQRKMRKKGIDIQRTGKEWHTKKVQTDQVSSSGGVKKQRRPRKRT
jgi:hypothetical protein